MKRMEQANYMQRQLISAAIMLCLTVARLLAQDGTKQYAKAVPPTLPVLYRQFLAYQLHLDRRADELKKAGRDAEDFRTHYQKEIGLSDDTYAKLRASALLLETQLAAKDAEATKVIQADRQANVDRLKLGFGSLPPLPAGLEQLQKDRDGIINNEVGTLRNKLLPDETARLDKFLTEDFSRSVTSKTMLPPHTSQPELLKKAGHP